MCMATNTQCIVHSHDTIPLCLLALTLRCSTARGAVVTKKTVRLNRKSYVDNLPFCVSINDIHVNECANGSAVAKKHKKQFPTTIGSSMVRWFVGSLSACGAVRHIEEQTQHTHSFRCSLTVKYYTYFIRHRIHELPLLLAACRMGDGKSVRNTVHWHCIRSCSYRFHRLPLCTNETAQCLVCVCRITLYMSYGIWETHSVALLHMRIWKLCKNLGDIFFGT